VTQRERDVIGGVDTHQDIHVVAAVDVRGKLLGSSAFAATAPGYRALLRWLDEHGSILAVGVEGTGTYGAGLRHYLQSRGVRTIEVNRPNRQMRRQRGKPIRLTRRQPPGRSLPATQPAFQNRPMAPSKRSAFFASRIAVRSRLGPRPGLNCGRS
jgi:Transposase